MTIFEYEKDEIRRREIGNKIIVCKVYDIWENVV
jgi:hypothetical protein